LASPLLRSNETSPLRSVSFDRLACLLRHWTWTDQAKRVFDRQLAELGDDENPMADRPFGSYYHWCALLCALSEAAIDSTLLSPERFDAVHGDIEATLPGLRTCRQLLIHIPASFEPSLEDLLHDTETLGRLRRLHKTFGDALHEEQMLREVDSLDH
jgi:hypothetical protein